MKFDPNLPFDAIQGRHHRRSVRLRGYDYSQAYFVTIVTFRRECLFGEIENGEMVLNNLGRIADECWCTIPEHFPFVELGAHIVMPNHVHEIISIIKNDTNDEPVGAQHAAPLPTPLPPHIKSGSLGAIVRSFKSAATRRAGQELNSANIWQRNYYEHIIRNETEMDTIWRYIESNPAMWQEDDENPTKK